MTTLFSTKSSSVMCYLFVFSFCALTLSRKVIAGWTGWLLTDWLRKKTELANSACVNKTIKLLIWTSNSVLI